MNIRIQNFNIKINKICNDHNLNIRIHILNIRINKEQLLNLRTQTIKKQESNSKKLTYLRWLINDINFINLCALKYVICNDQNMKISINNKARTYPLTSVMKTLIKPSHTKEKQIGIKLKNVTYLRWFILLPKYPNHVFPV